MEQESSRTNAQIFSGTIYIFHAFDIGDDINLKKVEQLPAINTIPRQLPKYFKNYHIPLNVELPHPHSSSKNIGCKIHNFGALSLGYKIPFTDTLQNIRASFNEIANQFQEQSVIDAKTMFKKISKYVTKSQFFQTKSSYIVMQVNPQPDKIDVKKLREQFGSIIASTLRFETKTLSELQKNEILSSAISYFRGDIIIVDTDAAFVYDSEYEEVLDFFEFADIQLLELRFFDRLLDQQLNKIYEEEAGKIPISSYLPFIGTLTSDPVGWLGKLKVDISVITERLESSIKVAGEPYFSDLYDLLVKKLDLKNWQEGIDRKLRIIHDVRVVYQHKMDVIREGILEVLIIILIFIELVIGIANFVKYGGH